jgi:hypothetical protein
MGSLRMPAVLNELLGTCNGLLGCRGRVGFAASASTEQQDQARGKCGKDCSVAI